MSYKLSKRVFGLNISPTEKLVLRAMADHADDDGTSCYPSVNTLTRETSLSRRTVQTTIRTLKDVGLLVAMGQSKGGRGRTPEYHLKVDEKLNSKSNLKGAVVAPFMEKKGATNDTERARNTHLKGAVVAPDSILTQSGDSKNSPPTPPANAGGNNIQYFSTYGELIAIDTRRKKRFPMTQNEKESMHGSRAADYLEFFKRKGFNAWIVPRLVTYDEEEEIKAIACETYKNETGRDYNSLETYNDAKLIMQVHAKAAQYFHTSAKTATRERAKPLFKARERDLSCPDRTDEE